jgi:hypothetical protein
VTPELIGQTRLADSRLAGQEIDLSAAGDCIVERRFELGELARPADEDATGARGVSNGS